MLWILASPNCPLGCHRCDQPSRAATCDHLFACDSLYHSSRWKYSIKHGPCSQLPPCCFYTGLRLEGVIKQREDQTVIGLSRRPWHPSHRLPDMELVGIWSKWTGEHGALSPPTNCTPSPTPHSINTDLQSLISLVKNSTTNSLIITWLSDRQNYSPGVRTKTLNMRSISDQQYLFFGRHSVSFTVRIIAQQTYSAITREANRRRRRVARVSEFCASARNICGSSALNLFYVKSLAPRIFRQLQIFFFCGGGG